MKKFINDNFLLKNEYSQELFSKYSKDMPIVDFHCHLEASDILEDKHWDNVAQVWLGGDHYKWRAMRSNGIDERFCTGETSDREKFEKFAATMPRLLRNPIYHWTHLEMARFFGIDDILLSEKTANEIWERANAVLQNGLSARECIKRSNVEIVCTTDDPISELSAHKKLSEDKSFSIKVLPAFRPDKAHATDNPQDFVAYMEKLSSVSGISIKGYDDLINALQQRHDFFDTMGCKISDNGVDTIYFAPTTHSELESITKKLLNVQTIDSQERAKFKSAIMLECAAMDARAGWARQLHIGALRNANANMLKQLGPDTGFDSIADHSFAEALAKHLDYLNTRGELGKTIIYNLNPKDNELVATMLGNFQSSICEGSMQMGSAWWFLDQRDGIRKQLEAISQLSVLSNFVGMVTDSRSFLSYPRHEYFRRILCQILGDEMLEGSLPNDIELVGECVKRISYFNSKNYFGF